MLGHIKFGDLSQNHQTVKLKSPLVYYHYCFQIIESYVRKLLAVGLGGIDQCDTFLFIVLKYL